MNEIIKGPFIYSSLKRNGLSKAVIFEVNFCLTPKCAACHITNSLSSINPLVLPSIAISFADAVDNTCKSILLDKSKTVLRSDLL